MNLIIHKNLHPNVETKCTTNHKDSEHRCYCYVPRLFNIPDELTMVQDCQKSAGNESFLKNQFST